MDTSRDPHRGLGSLPLRLALLLAAALFSGVSPSPAEAQQPEPYTLHVYTNLMQVPALVLGENLKPLVPLPPEAFSITLDAGPGFRPSHLRLEGEDPISLAVLLDASADEPQLKAFTKAFPRLAPRFLHPADRVSFFAVDCKLIRSATDTEAETARLELAEHALLHDPALHGDKHGSACAASLHLWDAVANVVKLIQDLPGRRVILVASPGADRQSTINFAAAARYATLHGVTVFGLRNYEDLPSNEVTTSVVQRDSYKILSRKWGDQENSLEILCQLNGGLVFNIATEDTSKTLEHFMTLLRGRYILEFPRPDNLTAGFHDIVVTIPGRQAFIRTTSASVPLPDPALAADPNTIPSAPSPATLGSRRHLDPKPPR